MPDACRVTLRIWPALAANGQDRLPVRSGEERSDYEPTDCAGERWTSDRDSFDPAIGSGDPGNHRPPAFGDRSAQRANGCAQADQRTSRSDQRSAGRSVSTQSPHHSRRRRSRGASRLQLGFGRKPPGRAPWQEPRPGEQFAFSGDDCCQPDFRATTCCCFCARGWTAGHRGKQYRNRFFHYGSFRNRRS